MSKKKLAIPKGIEQSNRTKFDKCKIAYATKAYHKMGDISRPYGDRPLVGDIIENFSKLSSVDLCTTKDLSEHLCILEAEDDENYYGSWVTGIGFFNVRYPKETTRSLTNEELDEIRNMNFRINSQPSWKVDQYETL